MTVITVKAYLEFQKQGYGMVSKESVGRNRSERTLEGANLEILFHTSIYLKMVIIFSCLLIISACSSIKLI